MKVLITGGAGYVGTSLTKLLLDKGYEVICLDNLHNQVIDPLIPFFQNKKFEFVYGDIRDKALLHDTIKGADAICHLAGIVGYPACAKIPEISHEINVAATEYIEQLRSPQQIMINAGTGSVYGKLPEGEGLCYETTPARPLSEYGIQKAEAEKIILDNGNSISLRFATAFGLSPKLRKDLLVNDFCYRALSIGKLSIYESQFKRTFVHVADMARSFLHCIENFDNMKNEIYNCGDESMNVRKLELAKMIQQQYPFIIETKEHNKDMDQRNYSVAFDKIRNKGFKTHISLEEGISEMLQFFKNAQKINTQV